jgi:hypothetical protein
MPLTKDTITKLKGIGLTDTQIAKFDKIKAARAPSSAKLGDLGFDAKAVAQLPPSVRNLTKSDLMALGGWGGKLSPAGAKITVTDIQRIKDVLGPAVGGGGINPIATDINCCCCPCCCAASVPEPVVIERSVSFTQ